MKNELLPIRFQGINDVVYAGFWVRVAAILLDFIILLPIIVFFHYFEIYLNSLSGSVSYYVYIPNLLFNLAFEVILVKIYGGTPGKLIMGLKIIQKNGDNIDWKASFYRYSIELFLAILNIYVLIHVLNRNEESAYFNFLFMKMNQLGSNVQPELRSYIIFVWILSEAIVLISNHRKRTIHDFIAGTVVVKSIYLNKIRESINSTESVEVTIE